MSSIEKIRERLAKYPELNYAISGGTITIEVPSPDGFSVTLVEENAEWVVYFDGWHEHFDDEEEALNCFAFGMSAQCRLKIELRGNFPYRWTVQRRRENGWEDESRTGLLFFPFWRRRRVEFRQNNVLKGI